MHDQNFKNLILDYPCEVVAFFAQEETRDDFKSSDTTGTINRLGDRFCEMDVPLLTKWPNGKRVVIVFVLRRNASASRFIA